MISRAICGLRNAAWRSIARDFALGLVAVTGLAPLNFWPVSLIALGLILHRVGSAETPGLAARRAWFIAAGWFGFGLSWIVQPFMVDPLRHGWMAPFALLGISFGLGLFWAAAGWLSARLRLGAIGFALTLSLAELARGHVLTGFPWALPGHIWAATPLAQMASLSGSYGMTALTLIALAAPLSYGWRRGGALSLAVLVLTAGWSWHRLALPEPAALAARARIVQPNIAQSLKWDPQEADRNFTRLLQMTEGAAADLVIWPETAVPYLFEPGSWVPLAMTGAGAGRPVVSGFQRNQGALAWNSLGVFTGAGEVSQSFDKMHLVPFGEYMPMGDLLWQAFGIRAFAAQVGAGYSAGGTRDLLDLARAGAAGAGRALPLICYEAIFPGDLSIDARADWMLQVTNDAWFGTLTGPYQHFDQTRLRAIEQGLPLLRAANTGISGFIDARGRVVEGPGGQPALLGLGAEGVIDAQIPGALAVPPYARMLRLAGEWPIVFVLLAGLVLARFATRPRPYSA